MFWEYPISLYGEELNPAMRPFVLFARIALLAFALLACSPASARNRCEELANYATPEVEITATVVVESGTFSPPTGKAFADLPPFCRVAAILHPSRDSAIRIELWMPEANWNGRLEGTGNGGFAGNLAYGALAEGIKRGYAVVNTDMGMATPPGEDATVFIERPERLERLGLPIHSRNDGRGQAPRRWILQASGNTQLLRWLFDRRRAGVDGSAALSR